ncbi:MAG: MMPL family transporter [Acidimicrobiia bacterium]|nr:MMPL family transporter [Acidimicrobiia bacterium]
MTSTAGRTGTGLFEWINRHIRLVTVVLVVFAFGFLFLGESMKTDENVTFEPTGELFQTQERAVDLLSPTTSVVGAVFLVEDPAGVDVLTRRALLEYKENSDTLRADGTAQSHLVTVFNNDIGLEIEGVFSIADAVDAALPTGLAGATDTEVKLALNDLLAVGSPLRNLVFNLSQDATAAPAVVGGNEITLWQSPVFLSDVRYNLDTFTGETEDDRFLEAEVWLREAQTTLRGDQNNMEVIGVAIDFNTSFNESFEEGGPYIFLAVAFIMLLVGALLRSYWAAVTVAAGLSVTMMIFNGFVGVFQLEVSPLLQLIVPIAMISFGVDFFIHASGRTREIQVEGETRARSYPLGLSLVFKALLMAALSSAAAFLSNIASGIEAITEFGVGAAVALVVGAAILGLIVPKWLLVIEEKVGPSPADRGLMISYKIGFFFVALIAGVMVAMNVVFPTIGVAIFVIFSLLFIYLPYRLTLRRNARAVARGRPMSDEVKGAGHGLRAAGTLVHFLARWRVITIPVVAVLAVAGVWGAFQVSSEFQLKDFLPEDSNPIVSLDKLDEHFGQSTGGEGFVYVEGDLTEPATILAMEQAIGGVVASGAELSVDFNGDVITGDDATTIVRTVMASGAAQAAVTDATGVAITDTDGDGLPDSAAQVAAVYQHAYDNGVVNDAGQTVFSVENVQNAVFVDGPTRQATALTVGIPSFVDAAIIDGARTALEAADSELEAAIGGETEIVAVAGEVIVQKESLDAFVNAMVVSIPIAVLLATLIAAAIMRSFRYAVTAIVPILLVVAWVYGFMWLADLKINPVTATIAAIAIGIGIDFATHFTVRFREEFEGEPSRFPALRRAGEGTGGALAISALTSILGFFALSLAPTPIFATFGLLTAVMIAIAFLVSIVVLPSLLLFVTPSRKGEEREELIRRVGVAGEEYEPHRRETALRRTGADAAAEAEAAETVGDDG